MMHKSPIDILLPEPKPNSELKADELPSAKLLQNPMFKQHLRWAALHFKFP